MNVSKTETDYSLFKWVLPDGTQALLTVWPNGKAEVAYRGSNENIWGPPYPVEHFEGRSL